MESENKLIFIVDKKATKQEIKKALEELYKIKIDINNNRLILEDRKTLDEWSVNASHIRKIDGIVYLQQNRTIKSKTYANINSVSLPSALKDLAEMIKFGYLKKIGSFRGAYYILDEKTAEKLKGKQ